MRFLTALLAAVAIGGLKAPAPALVGVERIWGAAAHIGFTDLARFKDRWYCAFREAGGRETGDGVVRILSADDGARWRPVALLSMRDADLRFPKLSVTPDRRLMLSAAAHTSGGSFLGQSLAWFTSNGREWGDAIEIGDPNVWLWRLAWRQDRAFTVGYTAGDKPSLHLYQTRDGLRFDRFPESLAAQGVSGEAALVFLPDGTALCLLHLDSGGGKLGRARPPYRAWTWKDLPAALARPNLLRLGDGRIVAAGSAAGEKARTVLCWLDPDSGSLEEFLALPSGGEAGCPGLVYDEGTLWVSYESSHEGKPGVYIARVKM